MNLEGLLTIWRECRSAALSEAIALVGPRIDVKITRITELDDLAAREPDPRVAVGVVAALDAGRLWNHLHKAHELLLHHGDRKLLELLEARWRGPFSNAALSRKNFWAKTAFELRALLADRKTDDARDATLLDEARAATTPVHSAPPRDGGPELLQRIYDDPADTAARQIYADYLIERGDPRGEFISLQLRGGSPKRENELLKKHVDEWLGPIAPIVLKDGRVFSRGFLHAARVMPKGGDVIQRAIGAPEWSTVVDLDLSVWRSTPNIATHDTLRALRTLRGVDALWMAHVPLSAPHIVLDPRDWFGPRTVSLLMAQAKSCIWKNVEHLEMSIPSTTQTFGTFWESGFARALAQLSVSFVQPTPGLLPLAALAATPVPIVRVMREPELADDWRYELVRDGGGQRMVRATSKGSPAREMLVETLRGLPRNTITRVEVDGKPIEF